jgi:hypothetical protein
MISETTVKVGVRIRPLLETEKTEQCSEAIRVVHGEPQVVEIIKLLWLFNTIYIIDFSWK